MGTRRSGLAVARVMLVAAMVLLLSAVPASAAGPPLEGSGQGMITGLEVTHIRDVGGNSHQARSITGVVSGTLVGTFTQETVGTVHTNHPDNLVTFRGVLLFTGTIDGCGDEVHTVALGLTGKGTVPVPGMPVTESSVRVIDHHANTLHATGRGTIVQEGPSLTYELQYRCR